MNMKNNNSLQVQKNCLVPKLNSNMATFTSILLLHQHLNRVQCFIGAIPIIQLCLSGCEAIAL